MKKFTPSGYYEAKIQIRPKDEPLLNFIKEELEKNNISITDKNILKEGIDLYINSSDFAIKLAKKFRNKYKIKPKVTRSLTGEDKHLGKRIYKLTVSLKLN